MGTLSKFVVKIHGVPVTELSTDTAKEIIMVMCVSAAEAIQLQCGREYGFSDKPKLATDIKVNTNLKSWSSNQHLH